jgi:hypothetical protein
MENLSYEINGKLHIKGRPSSSIMRFKSEGNLNLGNQSI